MAATLHDVMAARLAAADVLDVAVRTLGQAYAKFVEATTALERETGARELDRYTAVPMVLSLSKAGFGSFLEQKFVGTPPGLRVTVETQHRKLGLDDGSASRHRTVA